MEILLQRPHESTLHRRHWHHQQCVHPFGLPARHQPHTAYTRTAFRGSVDGAETVKVDINDAPAVSARSGPSVRRCRQLDRVYSRRHRTRLSLFRERTRQYIFISSASAYQNPATELPDYRIDAAGQSALGLFEKQDRVRRASAQSLPRRRLSGHHRPAFAHLWRESDSAGNQQLATLLHGGRPDAERAKGHRSRRRNIALGDHAQQ